MPIFLKNKSLSLRASVCMHVSDSAKSIPKSTITILSNKIDVAISVATTCAAHSFQNEKENQFFAKNH